MRVIGAGFEFGMELNADVKVAISQLYRLHDVSGGRGAADGQAGFLQFFFAMDVITTIICAIKEKKTKE